MDGHNIEVEFYQNARNLPGFLCPKIYASEKIVVGKERGLLAMQDLTKFAEPLGFYRSANTIQVLNVARALANLQFSAKQKEFENWWKTSLRPTVHLEEIYTNYTDGSLPELKTIPGKKYFSLNIHSRVTRIQQKSRIRDTLIHT